MKTSFTNTVVSLTTQTTIFDTSLLEWTEASVVEARAGYAWAKSSAVIVIPQSSAVRGLCAHGWCDAGTATGWDVGALEDFLD